jgi:hypothetical protein
VPVLKKIIFYVFVLLALIAGIWCYFYLKGIKKPGSQAITAFPDSCIVYFQVNNYFELNKKVNSQSLVFEQLRVFQDVNKFCHSLYAIDSLVKINEVTSSELADNPIYFAVYPGKELSCLAAFNVKLSHNEENFIESFSRVTGAVLQADEFYKFTFQKKDIFFKTLNGIVAFASDEDMIRGYDKGPRLADNKHFKEYIKVFSSQSNVAVYLDHKLYSDSKLNKRLRLETLQSKGHSAGIIETEPTEFSINGYLQTDSSDLNSLLLNEEAVQSQDLFSYLPQYVTSFEAFGFSSYKKLVEKSGKKMKLRQAEYWKNVSEDALYNVEENFYSNLGGSLVKFQNLSSYVSIAVLDTMEAQDHLKYMSDSVFIHQGNSIYRMKKYSKKLSLFLPWSEVQTSFAFILKDHLYFSDDLNGLLNLCASLSRGKTLITNANFISYAGDNFIERYNYLFYSSPRERKKEVLKIFGAEKNQNITAENLKHFSYGIVNDEKGFKYRMHLISGPADSDVNQQEIWNAELDTTIFSPPFEFINHLTGEKEILVQDNANTLYLLNAKGTILWRKRLNEKIASDLFTVDAFRNNKFQVLFNTKNYIHLIDRLGREVEGYPVKLPAEATAPMAKFDYENNGEWRLLIPCSDKNIYNFSLSGKFTEGFAPFKTAEFVSRPVQYVKIGSFDYLVALDDGGKIYSFSRKGIQRLNFTNRAIEKCDAFYIDVSGSPENSRIIYVDDKNGLVNIITFNDKKSVYKIHGNIDNSNVSFAMIDENRQMDILISSENRIAAYTINGELIAEENLEFTPDLAGFFNHETNSEAYALNLQKQELHLFDLEKKTQRTYAATGRPLMTDLFRDHKKCIVLPAGRQLLTIRFP